MCTWKPSAGREWLRSLRTEKCLAKFDGEHVKRRTSDETNGVRVLRGEEWISGFSKLPRQ